MRRSSRFFARAGVTALAVLAVAQGAAFAKARLTEPPARTNPAGDDVQTDCNGTGTMNVRNLSEGATAMQIKVNDVDSFGCIQVAFFDGTTLVGDVQQQVDNNPAQREVTFANVPIPPTCRTGKTCTVHMRQLLAADAGACPGTPMLGNGALGNRYSCGDFRVQQAPPPDANVPDAAPPPADGAPPPDPFVPIPEPVGDSGVVKVSGLAPGDAEAEGCAVGVVGQGGFFGAGGALVAGIAGLVLVARRRRDG